MGSRLGCIIIGAYENYSWDKASTKTSSTRTVLILTSIFETRVCVSYLALYSGTRDVVEFEFRQCHKLLRLFVSWFRNDPVSSERFMIRPERVSSSFRARAQRCYGQYEYQEIPVLCGPLSLQSVKREKPIDDRVVTSFFLSLMEYEPD